MSAAVYIIIFIALMAVAVGGVFFSVIRPWAPWYHRKSVSEEKPFQRDLGIKTPDIARPVEDDASSIKPSSPAASAEDAESDDEADLYESFYEEEDDK